jgi:hypothetical protein
MPAEARWSRARVAADVKLEVESRRTQGQRLDRIATERPSPPGELAAHRHARIALRDDVPRSIESEAITETAGPRDHREAAPADRRREPPSARFGEDAFFIADDRRYDAAALARRDLHDHAWGAQFDQRCADDR